MYFHFFRMSVTATFGREGGGGYCGYVCDVRNVGSLSHLEIVIYGFHSIFSRNDCYFISFSLLSICVDPFNFAFSVFAFLLSLLYVISNLSVFF